MTQRKTWASVLVLVLFSCFSSRVAAQANQCELNPQFNPSCPGYVDPNTQPPPEQPPPEQPPAPVANPTVVDSTQAEVNLDVGGIEATLSGEPIMPDGLPASVRDSLRTGSAATITVTPTTATRPIPQATAAQSDEREESQEDALGTGITWSGTRRSSSAAGSAEEDAARSLQSSLSVLPANAVTRTEEEQSQKKRSGSNAGAAIEGGADFSLLAAVPRGFDAYSQYTLTNIGFYPPKEIYQNTPTVDNRRALQSLTGASDRLHRDLVDQQYSR
jgi:hypothetical protein